MNTYIYLVLALFLATAAGQSVCTTTAVSALAHTSAGTKCTNSTAYSTVTGLTLSCTGLTASTANIETLSGWTQTGDTVLRATVTATTGISSVALHTNSTTGAVIGNLLTVYYIGFKASATSVSYTITPSGTSAGYNVMLGTYGWQNGINCQATCAKVLYQYTILSVATPGLLDCYGSHITALVSAFFVILALLF